MEFSAVFHQARVPMCCPVGQDGLQLTLRTGRDVERVWVVQGDPYEAGIAGGARQWHGTPVPMQPDNPLAHQAQWTVLLHPPYRRCRYYFLLEQAGERWYYYEDGLHPAPVAEELARYFTMPWMNPIDRIQPPAWVGQTVWYQIFPDRFCRGGSGRAEGVTPWREGPVTNRERYGGDLAGITQKLDYLQALGINGLYLNPIFAAPSVHKYDTEDYTRVDPDFGTEADLIRLVEAAHARGIRVMLDAVFNHTGTRFAPWRDVVEKGPASRYWDWFLVRTWPLPQGRDTRDGCYASFAFHRSLPKLNTNNPEVERWLCGVCEDWVRRYGIDGLRFDVGNEISHHFLKLLRRRLRAVRPGLYLLGEIWHEAADWLEGDEYDGVMNYPLLTAIRRFFEDPACTGEQFGAAVAGCLAAYAPQVNGAQFNLLDSHDTVRLATWAGDSALCQLTALFTLPGSPCLYYGTEVGLEGGHDPDCRRCMPWTLAESPAGQAASRPLRRLIALRRSEPALQDTRITFCPAEGRLVRYRRGVPGRQLEVFLNAGTGPAILPPGGEVLFAHRAASDLLQPGGALVRRADG